MTNLDGKYLYFSWREAILNSDLNPTTRHVLLTLSCHMNALGEKCYPSVKLLAKETGLSERCVVTHLQLAIAAKWITVSEHGFSGQGWRRHQYSIGNLSSEKGDELGSAPQQKVLNVVPKGAERGDEKVMNDVQSSTSVSTTKSSSVKFRPPTIAEIEKYMVEIQVANPREEAPAFFDHHQTRGWIPGGSKVQMKNWKSAVGTWKRNQGKYGIFPRREASRIPKPTPAGLALENKIYEKFEEMRENPKVQ